MGDHYIPKFYLGGFASSVQKLIWVYDKVEKRKYRTQIKNVANENAFYPPSVEKYLANFVEGPANTVIRKIRDRVPITIDDKHILTEYMAVMVKRVPEGIERVKKHIPGIVKKIADELNQELTILATTNTLNGEVTEKHKTKIDKILSNYSQDPPREIWLDNIPPERSPRVVKAIKAMSWKFLFCDDPVFLTCDNPVFFFTSIGVGQPRSEITFPISSNVVLWGNWREEAPNKYLPIQSRAIKEVNRRTATNTTRFIYSIHDESWILPFALKDSWALHFLQ